MVWKQLPCGHIFCHNCLAAKREQRRKKQQDEADRKFEEQNKERQMISWRREKVQVKNDICCLCHLETENDPEISTSAVRAVPVNHANTTKKKKVEAKTDSGLRK